MKKYIAELHYKKKYNLFDKWVLLKLKFGSIFYRAVVSLRLVFYKLNVLKSVKVDAYVISVGNITTGGTGKTPVTAEIANYITNVLGKKNAIISRGYAGGLSSKNTNIIKTEDTIMYNAQQAGEEPYWLAENCAGSVVITGQSRINSANKAIKDYESEVIILDDGFQHVKIKRDLNIAVIDGYNQFGNNFILPAGPLREPLSELKRADAFIIADKYKNEIECEILKKSLEAKYKKPTYISYFQPSKIYNIKNKEDLLESLGVNEVIAFCGIGQPDSFFNFIEQLHFKIADKIVFPDHYVYKNSDIDFLTKKLAESKALAIVTTEKDAVKIAGIVNNLPVYALQIKPELDLVNLLKDLRYERK